MSTGPSAYVFQPNKRRMRRHNKSRKGCLACKSRKVKVGHINYATLGRYGPPLIATKPVQCSETFPTCDHCHRLDLDCVYPQPPTALPTPPSENGRRVPSLAVENDVDDFDILTVAKITVPTVKSLTDCVIPSSVGTREYVAVLESLHFFNNRLLLEITPAHPPFRRTLIEVSQWMAAPRVVQLALIVATLAVQRSRSCSSPSFDKDVMLYRGTCLSELTALIKDVDVDSQVLAFDCIQLVMLADMQLEPLGSWAYHLEGTRRLIELQGGLSSLFYQKSALQNLLINYMEIDILTSATCSVGTLDHDNVAAQGDYIALLADQEEETITTACFMPVHLLQSTADVNKLRLRCSQHDLSPSDTFAVANEFSRIQRSISAFDPSGWASRILTYGKVLPQHTSTLPSEQDTAAMAALALCHQASATIYLHLSCNPSPRSEFLNVTHQSLASNLSVLISLLSPDTEAPLHTQLYKFATWPLFVAVYARVGWDLGDGDDEDGPDRLRYVAKKIQSRPLAVAAGVMDRVQANRVRRGSAGGLWAWDDAFEGRCSFCVL
jgi:hypothetical protein